jgi:hypothetical protein
MQTNSRVVLNHGDEISLVVNSRGNEKEREESFAVFIFRRPPDYAPDDGGEGESRTLSMECSGESSFSKAVGALGSSESAFTETAARSSSRGRSKRPSQKAKEGRSGGIKRQVQRQMPISPSHHHLFLSSPIPLTPPSSLLSSPLPLAEYGSGREVRFAGGARLRYLRKGAPMCPPCIWG